MILPASVCEFHILQIDVSNVLVESEPGCRVHVYLRLHITQLNEPCVEIINQKKFLVDFFSIYSYS